MTEVVGFRVGAAAAGVRDGTPSRLDVALIVSDRPCAAAGVFTTNQVIAAPCVLTRRNLEGGYLRAIVVNSGNANACTGEQGERDAAAMAAAVAEVVGCSPDKVAVASTGVIGVPLPADRITKAVRSIALGQSWPDVAQAIMTTDTRPKLLSAEVALASGTVHLRGVAKGAGMIHPNMATLLSFVLTDAAIEVEDLRGIVRDAATASFNAISIDGDTSTNDTLLVLANGASDVRASDAADLKLFAEAVRGMCEQLARAILADGEGVTKVFEVRVRGAASADDARLAARTITTSNLVKTAIHGADPNWGRILAAAGRSGARLDQTRATIRIGGIAVFERGALRALDGDAVRRVFERSEIAIDVDLGLGDGSATAWGTDLSAEYVRINADYTT